MTFALTLVSILGALASVYFLYLQVAVIQAFCIYCIVSAVVAFLLMGLLLRYSKLLVPQPPAVVA